MTWIFVACVLGVAAVLITQRAAGDRTLTWIVGASFVIRGLAAVVLFFVSSLKLPVLQSSQLEYGLWVFGADGVFYHNQAMDILNAWRFGTPLIEVTPAVIPSLLMAMLYAVTGPSPLHFILVNAWLGAMSGLLAYLLASRLGDRRGALPAAALVAFWPSSILWSTQLLKDTAVIALELTVLLLVVTLWQRYSSPANERDRRTLAAGACWAALLLAVFVAASFRPHIGFALTVSAIVILGVALGRALLRNRWAEIGAAVGIIVVVGSATLASTSLNLTRLVSPPQREVKASAPQVAIAPQVARGAEPSPSSVTTGVARPAPDVTPDVNTVSPAKVTTPGNADRWTTRLQAGFSMLSVDAIVETRRAQVIGEGGTLIDTTLFRGPFDIVAYLPRAIAFAYLAPFPWQLMSSEGHTGMLRPASVVEIVLIALLIPAMVIGCWQRARRFRPDEWLVLAFIICLAVGYGVMVPNGGTLFRARLQYLFPSLILASSALPAFVYRLFER